MFDSRALQRIRVVLAAVSCLAIVASAAGAQPFLWSVPMGGESWSTGHVHTLLWSGGPAAPINIHLIHQPSNTIAQTITLGDTNDGERQFRLNATLAPGTYQMYIEDVAQTTWAYGQQFHVAVNPPCAPPCTDFAFGAPLVVCGQTQAEAEGLAIALAQSHISCGMAGSVQPGSVQFETTLVAVGPFNCPPGYGGAYAVEVSALWCCCQEPVGTQPLPWSHVKSLYRDLED